MGSEMCIRDRDKCICISFVFLENIDNYDIADGVLVEYEKAE